MQKTFVREDMKAPNQMAGEILSFFTRNNFAVADRGETITYADFTSKLVIRFLFYEFNWEVNILVWLLDKV